MEFRRSKIVCTLGPATDSAALIERLLRAGMDVARLNFSHASHDWHARTIARLRAASGRLQKPIAILADLGGPKIRTGALGNGTRVMLRAGQHFTISTDGRLGDASGVSTSFKPLPHEVRRGSRVLLADGLIELRVQSVRRNEVVCEVVNGGELGEHQGINLPGTELRVPSLLPKDYDDLAFALKHGVNYVAVSFVRRPQDVEAACRAIKRAGADTPIIAKLEKPQAIANLDAILAVSNGVMVARGDLGVEMSPEAVPVLQKQIIARARDARLPVITATQMLESMTENPRPTRAEASDVANAVLDGSDALMLSGETARGKYPIESVQMMDRIIREAESSVASFQHPQPAQCNVAETTAELICHASEELDLKAIAVFTETGSTARLISQYRPQPPIVAFTPFGETRRRLALLWGVLPRSIARVRDINGLALLAEKRLLEEGLASRGDVVGIVAGIPLGSRGNTNFIKLHAIASKKK
ncbi:MAG TPA: pyruvate kinase [Candidatus Limnocylindrales bacterium]|nr:pyruvate kinase [Candidatus Limnocylindrales bacterium]